MSTSDLVSNDRSYPLVTIAIPTFNRASLLRECVRSALSQTYRHFEVLVSDNASTDETKEILGQFSDGRLRVIGQETNIGLLPNWNACLAEARGDYVIFLPVDQPYEDVFRLDFWKSIARADRVRAGDKIVVIKDDISLVAELVVRESIGKHARIVVGEVGKTVFLPVIQDAGDDEQYEIRHLGMQDQWAVLLRSTQRVLAKDIRAVTRPKAI